MKKTLLSLLIAGFCLGQVSAQSFYDDFEAYDAGSFLGTSAPEWSTWSDAPGSAEDVRVTDVKAYSGTKSIYFESNTGNGGPQDVVLYFGDNVLREGVLTNSMALLVEPGKTGYFNYQGTMTIGTTWTMNLNLANGVGTMDDPASGDEISFLYPEGEWFEMTLKVNLTANKWQVSINGECQGTFENRVNTIASIDLFPLNGSAFYIDDFSFEYEENAPEITNDAGVVLNATYTSGLVGTSVDFTGQVTNNSTEPLTEFEVTLSGDNLDETYKYTGPVIAPGATTDFVVGGAYGMREGINAIEMNITSVNGSADIDQDVCNDRSRLIMNAIVPAPNKRIIIEEGTGTWCGYCPRGAVFLDRLTAKYPERFISIAVHNRTTDPMLLPAYDAALGFTGFPNSTLNRTVQQDPSALENPFLAAVVEPALGDFEIGAELDEIARILKISIETSAFEALSSSHKLNVILKENDVTGTTSGYAQSNYFSGDDVDMGGYEDLPSTVPASMMVYDHVARAMLTPFNGMVNSYPEGIPAGETRLHNFEYEIPAEFDIEHIEIVAMLINANRTINNGAQASIEEAVANGFKQVVTNTHDQVLQSLTTISPNPTASEASIQFTLQDAKDVSIEVYDMTGKQVSQRTYGSMNGNIALSFDGGHLTNGMYIVKINAGNTFISKRLMIQK